MTLPLALTVGDAAGIGPEVVLRALASADRPPVPVRVYGPVAALRERAARFALPDPAASGAELIDVPLTSAVVLGAVSAAAGRAAVESVLRAAADAREGRARALVTAPLNKESLAAAGYTWPGHTEMLAEAAGVSDVAMMFVGGGLRVALLTIHLPLAAVPGAIRGEALRRVMHLVHRELPRFRAVRRRIAVCGLNPHAGEGGRFGLEEEEVLKPAIRQLAEEGLDVHGPFSADSLFVRAARGEFDAVVAAYHDQGLIPVKLLSFGRAVNVTLGLPFVRTSVDHGTGFDIARQGIANPGSLLEAMRLAVDLTEEEPPPH